MKRAIVFLVPAAALFVAAYAVAETTDFGGFSERFKGGGDKIPPRCQIDLPTASTEPFFVKWNCTDDNAAPEEIRSELWVYRNGAPAGDLVANFLGFPASVHIDEGILGVANFTDGLPVGIKLLARDRAGITTISPLFTVRAQDNNVSTCSLSINKEGTEASGGTTGTPSESVDVGSANVNVTQSSASQVSVAAAGSLLASPCEIDSICHDDSRLTFTSNLTISGTSANGTVSVTPGNLVVNVTGSATVDGVMLETFNVSGETTIEGKDATLSLSCDR